MIHGPLNQDSPQQCELVWLNFEYAWLRGQHLGWFLQIKHDGSPDPVSLTQGNPHHV